MGRILNKAKELFFEVLPAFVFFLVMFHLLLVSKALLLRHYGIPTRASAITIVSALIAAKVVLIANRIPFLNLYPRKPLIYNVILKTVVFSVLTILFMMAEEFARLARTDGGIAAAWSAAVGDFSWPYFFARQLWVFVFILLYCAGSELTRVIGREKVGEIFFGSKK